ncbi:MAG: sigma-54 dependent transcriptional regulator [Melioribacteraceae bacterium]|nr:sigma-54 dependent transcriptional regulator [Melioribacteraceae bacterium]MCF8263298.1 sigma-54 dependent transcriptional regulator [Melioribacteraceae bacterium]MCF8431176.1 sigma-54 dependent transcriptional regulator [Melioribacteraceae bacterium]
MSGNILVVDDEKTIRESLKIILDDEGYETKIAGNGRDAFEQISSNNFDLVISDIKMPEMDGMELLKKTSEIAPETFFIIMTAYASVNTAIEALRKGAFDYLIKPIEFDDLVIRVKRLFDYKALSIENKLLRQRIAPKADFGNIIGSSSSMKKVYKLIEQVAPTNTNILISGKSGTGKELVAKAIHFNSKRKDKVFLPINCGAIAENLIESELFGHKKGAFTGAMDEKQGLFKVADGGTLFLDEIGDLPLNMQVKLLRVLEDHQFFQVGGVKPIYTDVRILAATNQDLAEKTSKGEFREDLYYRLNVVEIKLPSLNERKDDIPFLGSHFIEKYCTEMGKKILGVDNETMKVLIGHDWRGGVRELENVIERAVIFAEGETISVEDLSEQLRKDSNYEEFPETLKEATRQFEKVHIQQIIKKLDYNKEEAAKLLNIGLSSLYRKMEELGIPTKTSDE